MATKRSYMLSIRVRPHEIERLKHVADARDMTVAELVRTSLSSLMLKDLMTVELPVAKQPAEVGHA